MFSQLKLRSPSVTIERKETRPKLLQKDDIHLLQVEAEKIRNWHVHAEMNTKHLVEQIQGLESTHVAMVLPSPLCVDRSNKPIAALRFLRSISCYKMCESSLREKVVQNLRTTVDTQRKSLVEVQMQYETISNKMQEEVDKRKGCLQKVDATREMCNVVKSQVLQLEETLVNCQDLKSEIESDNTKQNSDFQKLAGEFKNLSGHFEFVKKKYDQALNQLHDKFEEDHKKDSEIISSQKKQICDYFQRLDQKEMVIEVLTNTLAETQEMLLHHSTENEKLLLREKTLQESGHKFNLDLILLKSVQKDLLTLLKDKEAKLLQALKQSNIARKLNSFLEQSLKEKNLALQATERKHQEVVSNLEKKSTEQSARLQSLTEDISTKNQIEKEHVHQLELLKKAKKDADSKIILLEEYKCKLTENCNQLVIEKDEDRILINRNYETISQLATEIVNMKVAEDSLQKELNATSHNEEKLKTEMQEKLSDYQIMQCQLNSTEKMMADSSSLIEVYSRKQSDLKNQLEMASCENEKLEDKLDVLEKDVSTANAAKTELQAQLIIINEQITVLQKENTEVKDSVVELGKSLKEKETIITEVKEELKQKTIEIKEQKKALIVSQELYKELQIIRNDQAQELSQVHSELLAEKDKFSKETESHKNAIELIKNKHQIDFDNLQMKLNAAHTKLNEEINKNSAEERINQTPVNIGLLYDSFNHSQKSRSKQRKPIFVLGAHELSLNGTEESWQKSPKTHGGGTKYIKPNYLPKHQSTPIQRGFKLNRSVVKTRKSASAKKPNVKSFWRKNCKAPLDTKKTGEDWFDVDKVYGFFD